MPLPNHTARKVLASALACLMVLPTPLRALATPQVDRFAKSCASNTPKSVGNPAELVTFLRDCTVAYRASKTPALAARTGWAAMQMAWYEHLFNKVSNRPHLSVARQLLQEAQAGGHDVNKSMQSLARLEAEVAERRRSSQPSALPFGADRSAAALCLYGVPRNPMNERAAAGWLNVCQEAYAASPSGVLAANYGQALVGQAALDFNRKDVQGHQRVVAGQRLLAEAQQDGWQVPAEMTKFGGDLDQAFRALKTSSQGDRAGLTQAQVLLAAGAVAALLALIYGSPSSGGDVASSDDPRSLRYDIYRYHVPAEQSGAAASPPRSYGLYGDCPMPGAGYGC